jgi:hypothetical protein
MARNGEEKTHRARFVQEFFASVFFSHSNFHISNPLEWRVTAGQECAPGAQEEGGVNIKRTPNRQILRNGSGRGAGPML